MIKGLEFMEKDFDRILLLDEEAHQALNEHRLDDYYDISTRICVLASWVAYVIKGMS